MPEPLQLDADHEPQKAKTQADTPDDKKRVFMALARERFRESAEGEALLRTKMLSDRRFASGGAEQWMDEHGINQQEARWKAGKPAVTANRINAYTRQVMNSMRESRPAIQYVGVDDDHDPELAEVLQGIARHVEQNSMADIAYETAAEHQTEGGRGWYYFRHDYVHDETDEQDIFIERVRNPDTVYPDVVRQKFDYSDARYLHHVEDMPLDEFNRRFPKDTIASLNEFSSIGDQSQISNWVFKEKVRVSNYYYIDHVQKTLVVMQPEQPPQMPPQPGGVLNLQQPQPPQQAAKMKFLEDLKPEDLPRVMKGPDGKPMVRRQVMTPQVMFAKIHGLGILEGSEDKTEGRHFPGRYIPYVPVLGTERDLNGEVDLRGMVRDMREAQQAINFWQSALTEAIGKVTHGTWILAEGQVTDTNQRFWDTANTGNYAFLTYKPVPVSGGGVAAPPMWNSQAPEIQSIVMALQIAENTLRATAGFYGMENQENKPEVSGKAILARQQQGERGSSHLHGNLGRAIRHGGRILLHMMPEVYDTARVKRINGIDDEEKAVQVYSGAENKPQDPAMDKSGNKIRSFDLSSATRYDVRVGMGPSMATKRQEASAALLELMKVSPAAQVLMDLAVKQMDFPGAHEAAKRLKNMLPPQALGNDDTDPAVAMQKAQMQVQQMGQMLDKITAELNAKNQFIETEQVKHESAERVKAMELESRELIAKHHELMALEIEKIKAHASAATTALQLQAKSAEQDRQLSAAAQQQDRALSAAAQQQQADRQHEHAQNTNKLDAGIAQTHMKGVQSAQQTGAEHEQELLIADFEASQREHEMEIQASHAKEQQQTEIQAQQQQAKMAQQPGPGQGGS